MRNPQQSCTCPDLVPSWMTLFFHALPCPLPGHAQNNYEKYDHKEITEFAIKIQLDEELCAELGAVPLSHDEILECQSLEEAC